MYSLISILIVILTVKNYINLCFLCFYWTAVWLWLLQRAVLKMEVVRLQIGANVYKNGVGTILAGAKLNGNVDEVKIYNQKVLDKSSDFWMLKVSAL